MAQLPPIKVKNLGQFGIITDQPPADLPKNAFTYGSNVRFIDGKVTRSPVMRRVFTPATANPVHVASVNFPSGFDRLFVAGKDFSISEYESGAEWVVSPPFQGDGVTAWATTVTEAPFTSSVMGSILYLNRYDREPVYKDNNSSTFEVLPAWPSTARARILRTYGDFSVVFGYTKAGLDYPFGVWWSDLALAGQPPQSWDVLDPTNSSGDNQLTGLTSPIVDAQVLRSSMMIYSHNEVYAMDFTGSGFIFDFRKVFGDIGAINANCAVEVKGKHYVFGTNDIYVHDGNTWESIVDGRVKEFILRTLNTKASDRCFVFHSKRWKEIYFCYQAGGDTVSYPNATGCNRAAVYNYQNDTWSFMDLPNVYSATQVNIEVGYLWGPVEGTTGAIINAPGTWEEMGGSWYDLEDGYERHIVMSSQQINPIDAPDHTRCIYALDTVYSGTAVPFLIDPIASLPPFVRRDYIDLDEDDGDSISAQRHLRSIHPQGRTYGTRDTVLKWKFGSTMFPAGQPVWRETNLDFRHERQYKIDSRASGRYLSYEVTMPTYDDFELSSMDLNVTTTGRR